MTNITASFKLDDSFIKKYESVKTSFGFNGLGELTFYRCVTSDTPVLCANFIWKPAGKLAPGEQIIGFDENKPVGIGKRRHFQKSIVTDNKLEMAEVMGIELEDGTIMYSTPDHPWLCRVDGMRWVQTKDLAETKEHGPRYLHRVFDVTSFDGSYESGYLGAAFDGEGSLDGISSLTYVQVENRMLEKVKNFLDILNIQYVVDLKKITTNTASFKQNQQTYAIRIRGGLPAVAKFLSATGDGRLAEKLWDRLEKYTLTCREKLRVVRVFDAGVKEIAVLSTSSRTHITNGFPSHNTYSRIKDDGTNEKWFECVRRVVEGTYKMQERHIKLHDLGWNESRAQKSAQEMYDRMFNMKFLPPGRGLANMGSPWIEEKGVEASLLNCAFVSTAFIDKEFEKPFTFLMDASMIGIGTGFDTFGITGKNYNTAGAGKITFQTPSESETYIIPDTREGWVESVGKILRAYMKGEALPVFDYSLIRKAGLPIKGPGGTSSGPGPLKELHEELFSVLSPCTNLPITVTNIVDIMNLIGKAVVSGNIRRCLPKGTLIHTNEGLVKIEDIEPGMLAKTSTGYSSISELVYQGIQSITSINTQLGEFRCTAKHKMAVMTSPGVYTWKHAEELVPGEKLVFVNSETTGTNTELPKWNYRNPEHSTEVPEFILSGTKEIRASYLAGLFDADGSCSNRTIDLVISIYPEYLKQVQAVYASLGIPTRFKLIREAKETWQTLYSLRVVGKKARLDFIKIVSQFSLKFHNSSSTERSGFDYGYPSSWIKDIKLEGKNRFWNMQCKQMSAHTFEKLGGDSKNLIPIEVISVNLSSGVAETYDISVPEANEFVCQEGLLVHNTAENALGSFDDTEFLDLKDYSVNPTRESYGWTSNNSIVAKVGMDYTEAAKRTAKNGEPGYFWLENARNYGRMNGLEDKSDSKVAGCNPCFHEDTLIGVADGRGAVSIKKLALEGNDVPIYSVNTEGKVEIKYARAPRLTRTNASLVEVLLDDGTSLKVTPDHKMRLIDGSFVEAKDLVAGDSLPRFTKTIFKATKKSKTSYIQVNCDTLDAHKDRIFEHKLIFNFFKNKEYCESYDQAKSFGWSKGGVVIHHKNYNGLDNNIDNLEVMTFKDHCLLHSSQDRTGYSNDMFGKEHSENTKSLIGEKSKERWSTSEFRQKIQDTYTEERRKGCSENLSKIRKELNTEYYLQQEAETDLDTIWIDGKLCSYRNCEHCGEKFIQPWALRHISCCSTLCGNKCKNIIEKRNTAAKLVFKDKQRETLQKQTDVYYNLKKELNRDPWKKEWEAECKVQGVPYRIRSTSSLTDNPYSLRTYKDLKERVETLNHKVVSISKVSGLHDVYDMTVDDNHTIAVITKYDDNKSATGIFTSNCFEQQLEHMECCCLVETFPNRHKNLSDFKRTLKFAYLYGKTVTLGKTPWPETNKVMFKNRRIGCSLSGIAQFIASHGVNDLKTWCQEGYDTIQYYDKKYSEWLGIPISKRTTSIKPSGSTSLLAGATAGLHFPESKYYIRRVRLSKYSSLIQPLQKAGYTLEDCVGSEDTTLVVSIPVKIDAGVLTIKEVPMWKQLSIAALLQKYWSNNMVSATITFQPEEAKYIKDALEIYQYQLKGISFLPITERGAYPQMPYEAITEEKYNELIKDLVSVDFNIVKDEEAEFEKFCDSDKCTLK